QVVSRARNTSRSSTINRQPRARKRAESSRSSLSRDRLLDLFLDQLDGLVQSVIDEGSIALLLGGLILLARLGLCVLALLLLLLLFLFLFRPGPWPAGMRDRVAIAAAEEPVLELAPVELDLQAGIGRDAPLVGILGVLELVDV